MKNILFIDGDHAENRFELDLGLKNYFKNDNIDYFKPVAHEHLNKDSSLTYNYNINHLTTILKNQYDLIIAVSRGCHYLLDICEINKIKTKIILLVPVTALNRKKSIFDKKIKKYTTYIDTIIESYSEPFAELGVAKNILQSKNYEVVHLEHYQTDLQILHLIKKNYI